MLHSPRIDRLVEVFVVPSTQHIKQKDVAFGGLKTEKACHDIKVLHICCCGSATVQMEEKVLQKGVNLTARRDAANGLSVRVSCKTEGSRHNS